MVKKIYKKKGARKGGRRLAGKKGMKWGQGPYSKLAGLGARAAGTLVRGVQRVRQARRVATRAASLAVGDNITVLPMTVIGTPRKLGFAEKVARVERPPILFKRNYQFSAEGYPGRKAWFNINFNHHSNDLNQDITTYKANLTTDTQVANDFLTSNSVADRARFYVDYMSSKLQLMNSSTNALTGKMHLFAVKRDAKATYNSVPVNPVNLMAYYSTNAVVLETSANEFAIGNGWRFGSGATSAQSNFTSNVNMPGSSLNFTGVCLSTDLALSPFSAHIKSDIGFWFKHVFTQSFNLKPGQQVNKVFKFNDLPVIAREQLDFEFLDGVSYQLAIEFQGQIVGSDAILGAEGVISTGSSQLSIIREDIRILGQKNALKSKVLLVTAPLSAVPEGNQIIINPDTGTQLSDYFEDKNN